MENETMVQAIAVAKTGSHRDTIYCGARASFDVQFVGDSEEMKNSFNQWLAGPFTKTVRRASEAELEKLETWAIDNNFPYSVEKINNSIALALAPMKYEEFPKILKKLQVRGTDLPKNDNIIINNNFSTNVNVCCLENLSTGKAVAQVAHGLWKAYLDNKETFNMDEYDLSIDFCSNNSLENLALDSKHSFIRDNGLTEIEPDTLTVVSWLNL